MLGEGSFLDVEKRGGFVFARVRAVLLIAGVLLTTVAVPASARVFRSPLQTAASVVRAEGAMSAAIARQAGPGVQICGAGPLVMRPKSVVLACADDGLLAEDLRWSSWTGTHATATGTITWLACTGACPDGSRWKSTAGAVTLTRPVREPRNEVLFTRLTLRMIGQTPAGFLRNVSFDETPAAALPAARPPEQPQALSSPLVSSAPSGTLGYPQIAGFWDDAGGPSASVTVPGHGTYTQDQIAAAITGAESSFEPGIIQAGVDYCGSGADRAGWGLWQITCGNSVPQFGTDFQVLDPWNNAEAAVAKYDQAGGFTPWTTYTTQAYVSYLQHTTADRLVCDPGEYVQINATPSGTPAAPAADPGGNYGPSLPCQPAAPTGLGVTSYTATTVSLSWQASHGASSYGVFLKDGQEVASGITGTSHTVTGLSPGTAYTFSVVAVNSAGSSPQSSPVSHTTLAATPTGLVATAVGTTSATLSWATAAGASSYNVLENDSTVGSTSSTSFVVTGLAPSTSYSFSVTALNSTGVSSPPSAALRLTTATSAAYVLGTNGVLWLESPPFGNPPPSRTEVDSSVAAVSAVNGSQAYVLGTNGVLWLESAPFGPSYRTEVDSSVAAVSAVNGSQAYVVGTNGVLWLESAPFGPSYRTEVDSSVAAVSAVNGSQAYVLGTNGVLWLESAPFGPSYRTEVDSSVAAVSAVNGSQAYVLGTNGVLWLESAPFGPSYRTEVDSSVAAVSAVNGSQAYVLGTNGVLWLESAPFGPPYRTEVDTTVSAVASASGP